MKLLQSLTLAAALAAATTAQAGRSCEAVQPAADSVVLGLDMAERTRQALESSGAGVVVLARAGQDLRQYGLQWSHLAFAYREPATTGEAVHTWRVVHKLNECGTDHAGLFRQGLGEFFMDNPFRYAAAFAPLLPDLAAKLLPLLQSNEAIQRMHEPRYSITAYPWSTRYQQSNQWLSETLASAMEPGVTNRERAQAWLQFKGYEPSELHIGALTRLGGRMTRANVAFDDHPNRLRYSDRIQTTTADSVFAWLQRAQLAGPVVTIRPTSPRE